MSVRNGLRSVSPRGQPLPPTLSETQGIHLPRREASRWLVRLRMPGPAIVPRPSQNRARSRTAKCPGPRRVEKNNETHKETSSLAR
jgi:hypothetical protein